MFQVSVLQRPKYLLARKNGLLLSNSVHRRHGADELAGVRFHVKGVPTEKRPSRSVPDGTIKTSTEEEARAAYDEFHEQPDAQRGQRSFQQQRELSAPCLRRECRSKLPWH
jgi:hypothetical protein